MQAQNQPHSYCKPENEVGVRAISQSPFEGVIFEPRLRDLSSAYFEARLETVVSRLVEYKQGQLLFPMVLILLFFFPHKELYLSILSNIIRELVVVFLHTHFAGAMRTNVVQGPILLNCRGKKSLIVF